MMLLREDQYNISWIGEPISKHESQTFYGGFSYRNKIYKLGDLSYIRHADDFERMAFLELYLAFELRGVEYLSVRAYYYPEDTVEGRFPQQGQDEVLCLEGEIVMSCHEFLKHLHFTHTESKDLPELRIVSFPAYCRCCAMRRRLGGCIADYVSHPLFGALGGVDPHFRVLFCRDSVPDKELQRLWKCQNYYREVPSTIRKRKRIKRNSDSENGSTCSGISYSRELLDKENSKECRKRNRLLPELKSTDIKEVCFQKDESSNLVGTALLSRSIEDSSVIDVEDTALHSIQRADASNNITKTLATVIQSLLGKSKREPRRILPKTGQSTRVCKAPNPATERPIQPTPHHKSDFEMLLQHCSGETLPPRSPRGLPARTPTVLPARAPPGLPPRAPPEPHQNKGQEKEREKGNVTLPNKFLSTDSTPPQMEEVVKQLVKELSRLQNDKNTQRKLKHLMKQ